MKEIFSLPSITEYFIIAIVLALLLTLCSFKSIGALQQTGYNTKAFLKWANKKSNMTFTRLLLLSFVLFLFSAITILCFSFLGELSTYVGFIPIIAFFLTYIYADDKIALKVKLKITGRIKRLFVALIIVLVVIIASLALFVNFLTVVFDIDLLFNFRYLPLTILAALLPYIIMFANIINRCFEEPRNRKYILSAQQKLAESNIQKIAITGSYAKTSVKNILSTLLREKYSVLATPESYNTPLGIAKTINDNDLSKYDYFIVEMGAKHQGDIKELCDIVKPNHAIITGICGQHLETFGDIETIIQTKNELLESITEGGFAVIGNDENTKDIYEKCSLNKALVPSKTNVISNLVCDTNGITFSYECNGEVLNLSSKLLGKHNAQNISLAVTMAKNFGVTTKQIERAIKKQNYVPHRLQKIETSGVTILDDSYNSSINGAFAGIEVLKLFKGRKIVVTPGLVELGVIETDANFNLGKLLKGIDLIILVGETLVSVIKEGAIDAKIKSDVIKTVPTLADAENILETELKEGDTILFLNDLPDIYN